jgi:ribosomal protein L7/L12
VAAWLSIAILGLLTALAVVQGRAKGHLGKVERKLDLLLRHSSVDVAAVAELEAAELGRAGKKIQAIRVYRDLTGASLVEAKRYVEGLQQRRG